MKLCFQKKECTLDVAVKNLSGLIEDLKQLRERFDDIERETEIVAKNIKIQPIFPALRKVGLKCTVRIENVPSVLKPNF